MVGVVGAVIGVVVLGIVGLIGILIFGELYQAMPTDDGVFADGAVLEGEAELILAGVMDAFALLPIVMLVMLAGVVIAVVQNMR